MMTLRPALVVLLALLTAPAESPPCQDQDSPRVPGLGERITFEATASLPELVRHFRIQTGASLVLDLRGDESDDLRRQASLRLREVPGSQILEWLCRFYGLDLSVKEGIVLLTRRRGGLGSVLGTYPVRVDQGDAFEDRGGRVEFNDPREPGLHITPSICKVDDEGVVGGCCGAPVLVEVLKSCVAPGTWEGNQVLGFDGQGRILAQCPVDVHREIRWLLGALESIASPPITVTVWVASADEARAGLLKGELPRIVRPEEWDEAFRVLHLGQTLEYRVTGLDSRRVHSLLCREATGAIGYFQGDPILKSQVIESGLLDVRPSLVDAGGAVQVELRLSLGEARPAGQAQTPPGALALQERLITRLSTTLRIPSGGGALLGLPSSDPSHPSPRICLLRAAPGNRSHRPPKEPILSPGFPPDPSGLTDRLSQASARELKLRNAPISEFATWIAGSGLNVVVSPRAMDEKVTAEFSSVRPGVALPLVLDPHHLTYRIQDGAIWIVKICGEDLPSRICVLDVRDLGFAPSNFTRESDPERDFTTEDLANLIKNTIHRGDWEEAEGRVIMAYGGYLILRNRDEVIQDCITYLKERRALGSKGVSLRADLAIVPVEALRGLGPTVGPEERERLLSSGTHREVLAWISSDQQRTLLEWERARDYVYASGALDALLRAGQTSSWVEVRPTFDQGSFGIHLWYRDHRITGVCDEKGREGIVQSVSTSEVSTKSKINIPAGKSALFSFPASGEAGNVRILLVRPALMD